MGLTIEFRVEQTILAIKSSYGDKYSDKDYQDFKIRAKTAKNQKQLVVLVENLFDLDYADARNMVY